MNKSTNFSGKPIIKELVKLLFPEIIARTVSQHNSIPCYNEEERLSSEAFREFAYKNLGYHLCFVNDGSTENTLKVLNDLRK